MTSTRIKCNNKVCSTMVMPFLYEMGSAINTCADLKTTVTILLKIMKNYMKVACGMFMIYHHRTGRIFVQHSIGLSDIEMTRGVYNIGEGITGKVVETGLPIIVPKIRDEPEFLNRTHNRYGDRLDYSFICIPIHRGEKVLGTISIEKKYTNELVLNNDIDILNFIASILAQSIDLYLLENEEKPYWESENKRLNIALTDKFHPKNIIGNSTKMKEVYNMVEKISPTQTTVLILGESGVGKEVFANAIHYNSLHAKGPFVKFNCAALPENIIESELFGHEKGAFTGASTKHIGRFEKADGGTIFLDEIGELSLPMQAKLLRVIQERTFERVGGTKPIKVNIRIISATNRNLQEMVYNKDFREDLFYRLNVFPIIIPPLRERKSDIALLCDHFILQCAKQSQKDIIGLSALALKILMSYSWPGNVRELENIIERAVILCEGNLINSYNLSPLLHNTDFIKNYGFSSKIDFLEYESIIDALQQSKGCVTHAAEYLGITRRMLGLRLNKYKIDYHKFK